MIRRLMRGAARAATVVGIVGLCGCACPRQQAVATVPAVDLDRYVGTWYELARYPNTFERGLVAVTATYAKRPDGTIAVRNAGHSGGVDGPERSVDGYAWLPDPTDTAKLRVRFFWPFWGSYWVIALAPDYRWAVVGHPDREYLWFLARSPRLDAEDWTAMQSAATAQGFDITRLERVAQR